MVNLSIVILSYNTKDLTLNCINSIIKNYKKQLDKGEFEIIVVDNASSDDSVSAISNTNFEIPNIRLILNKENLGFSKGCNIGAKNAAGKFVLFLNSDTEVVDNKFLEMIKYLDSNSRVGILGGKLYNTDGSIQPSCGKFYNLFNLTIMLLGLEKVGMVRSSPNVIKEVDWVSGACMMIRRELFEKLKGFDEKLFMYIEDMELCFRAKQNGSLTYFYPDINLIHKQLGSGNKTFAIIQIYKGILYFYSKHKSYGEYLLAKLLLYFKAIIVILIGSVINKNLFDRYRQAIKF